MFFLVLKMHCIAPKAMLFASDGLLLNGSQCYFIETAFLCMENDGFLGEDGWSFNANQCLNIEDALLCTEH